MIQHTHWFKYTQQPHTQCSRKCESLLIASLPAISSKTAPYFWRLETAEPSTETILASARHFAHSPPSFPSAISFEYPFSERTVLDRAHWVSTMCLNSTLEQSRSQAVRQHSSYKVNIWIILQRRPTLEQIVPKHQRVQEKVLDLLSFNCASQTLWPLYHKLKLSKSNQTDYFGKIKDHYNFL